MICICKSGAWIWSHCIIVWRWDRIVLQHTSALWSGGKNNPSLFKVITFPPSLFLYLMCVLLMIQIWGNCASFRLASPQLPGLVQTNSQTYHIRLSDWNQGFLLVVELGSPLFWLSFHQPQLILVCSRKTYFSYSWFSDSKMVLQSLCISNYILC